jgi:transketolase
MFLTWLKIGFGNAVGLAIAQAHTAAVYNKPGFNIIGKALVNDNGNER